MIEAYNYKMNHVEEFRNIQTIIVEEKITGAQLTSLIEDVQQNYEVASLSPIIKHLEAPYRDLLSKLIKTYGH
tara:strand:+ start:65 stop:283 length:219 start_codon:yes stop_codon:yes gene_type:complete